MNMILQIKFANQEAKEAYHDGKLLTYATQGSSGFDLRAINVLCNGKEFDLKDEKFELKPQERCLVKTGIYSAINQGFELQIRPRSGLALKNGITVLNTPGTVDSDYRGEIGVILFNSSNQDFSISIGDRIAQCVVCKIEKVDFKFQEILDETERSEAGFGSTGVR